MPRAAYNTLVIPYRCRNGTSEYAVFFRSDSKMCQFIAGGGEDSEDPITAARREALEEASIDREDGWMVLDSKASIPRTAFPGAPWPENVYVIPEYSFAVDANSISFCLSKEHGRYAWLDYQNAQEALTWDSNKVALNGLNERLKQTGQQDCAGNAATRRT